jgi:hypothetical protein
MTTEPRYSALPLPRPGVALEGRAAVTVAARAHPSGEEGVLLAALPKSPTPWVTWRYTNAPDGVACWSGHYHFTFDDAVADFKER